MAEISVRTKLTAGFGLALLMMLVVGLFGVYQLSTLSRFMTEIGTTWLPRREALGNVRVALTEHQLRVTQRMGEPDGDTAADLSKSLGTIAPIIDKAAVVFSRTDGNATDQTQFNNFVEHWHAYEASLQTTAGFQASGDTTQARETFNTVSTLAFDDAAALVGNLLQQSRRQSERVLDRAKDAYWAGIASLIAGILIAGACVGAAIWWITRNITLPIVRLRQIVKRLAAGDLSVDSIATDRSRRDEIGDLIGAVDEYRRSLARADELKNEADLERQRLQLAIRNMPLGLSMFDGDRRLIICNGHFAEMYGLPPELTRPGTSVNDIVRYTVLHSAGSTVDPNPVIEGLGSMIDAGESFTDTVDMGNGRQFRIIQHAMDGGGWLSIHEDVTERRETEARIAHMIRHDALTGVSNRLLLRETIAEALAKTGTEGPFALVAIDLDDFKAINDTLGQSIGDQFLKAVAERLRLCIGPADLMARIGGDEFAIVQRSTDQPDAATRLARSIAETLGAPFTIDGHRAVVCASIGIAVAPQDGNDPNRLLQNAELALHRAKNDGRGCTRFFEPGMDAALQARRKLELDLREALRRREFELHYQPLLRLKTGTISGFEALLRWRHPERGLVMPNEFIGLCEELGLIVPIGTWVLKRACQDAMTWPGDTRVAVNLSAMQFRGDSLVPAVVGALDLSGLPAQRLELEITETVLLTENDATLSALHQLRSLGVRVALDDFGTGYSSLSYLRSFPFDKIKLDRSFVRDLSQAVNSLAIIRAVAALSSSLGVTTTAEGVETQAQLDRVRAEGFTEAQGFLISEPVTAAEVPKLFYTFAGNSVAAA